MRRRAFIAFAAAALTAAAQAAPPPGRRVRIGFIAITDSFAEGSPNRFAWLGLEQALAKLGYREGGNMVIERRHASGDASRLSDAVHELLATKPEVVVTFGAQSVTAMAQASAHVPIVSYTNDLVALGLAQSFARPGGNVTGVSPATSALTLKQLEILAQLVPGARRVAWLRNPSNATFDRAFGEQVERAGATLGLAVARFDAGSADALEAAVREIARQGFDAVLVPADVIFVLHRVRLSALFTQHRIPAASLDRVMLDAGLLLTYGVDVRDGIRRMAHHIDKILHGTPPGEIPIEFIERFELGINLRTAKAIGVRVPQTVLLRADQVIE